MFYPGLHGLIESSCMFNGTTLWSVGSNSVTNFGVDWDWNLGDSKD